jgi:hypothetical protein
MEVKQTAVEWLVEQMSEKHYGAKTYFGANKKLIEQSKEMEKEKMIDFAFNFYYDFCNKTGVPFNLISENRTNVEEYYTEKYGTVK